ncbi:hypothetical protein pb186bvf_000012 [Paramecium bursaria]
MSLNKISRTAGFLNYDVIDSDEENKPLKDIFVSVKDRLPKPNPLFQQDLNISINAAYKLRPNLLEIKETVQKKSIDKQIVPPNFPQQSLREFISQYKLIYQKYEPQQNEYFATYINKKSTINIINNDINLEFDSLFEGGNLFQVYYGNKEYYLLLENDVNTKGYTQWFFFSVISKLRYQTLKFNIININKDMRLYRQGMKILVNQYNSWSKESLNSIFYKNKLNENLYTLSFSYSFSEYGQVYFASNYPYTLTNLNQLVQKSLYHPYFKAKILCKTFLGNNLDIITITQPSKEIKTGIVFMARQHPGETVGSFVLEGIIEYLLSEEAYELRKKYVFKIVPIVNVDGVIHGNQRCNVQGYDMNRKWNQDDDNIIKELRNYFQEFNSQYKIKLILDLHGHSKKTNGFFYGQQCSQYLKQVCNIDKRFDLEKSRFMYSSKILEATARVTLQNLFKEALVYTVEISYQGYQVKDQIIDFTIQDFKEMGKSLCIPLEKDQKIIFLQTQRQQDTDSLSQSDSNALADQLDITEIEQLMKPQNQETKPRSLSIQVTRQKQQLRSLSCKKGRPNSQSKPKNLNYNFIYGSDNKPRYLQPRLDTKQMIPIKDDIIIFKPQERVKPFDQQLYSTPSNQNYGLKQQFFIQAVKRKQKLEQQYIQNIKYPTGRRNPFMPINF